MKSLLAKELLQINARFIYGDFMGYLEIGEEYDLVVASGVLYHMINPVELLCKIAECTNRIYLWTHYFDPNTANLNGEIAKRVTDKFERSDSHSEFAGFSYPVVTQKYLESLNLKEFCGGPKDTSAWMYRDDILDLLGRLGFQNIEVVLEDVGHQNGPSFAVYAKK